MTEKGNHVSNSQGKHFGQQSEDSPVPAQHADGSQHTASPANNQRAAGFIPVVTGDPHAKGSGARFARSDRRMESGNYLDTDPYDLSGRRSRDPRKRRNRIVSTMLFIVGIALLAIAAGMWGYSQWQYHEQDVINEKLAQYATIDDEGNSAPVVDWASLKAINPEVVGWIEIPNTVVSFPVYQASDNDKYLHTNAEGAYSLGGQVFMDYQNQAPGMLDQQTIIYGHHLRNGAMFKPIADMDNQEAFDSVGTVWYVTEGASYELEPLLLYYTDEDDTNVRTFGWASEDEFHTYLSDLLAKSVTSRPDAAELIGKADHVLTLCTCNYIDGYGRTILVCVPKSEVAS